MIFILFNPSCVFSDAVRHRDMEAYIVLFVIKLLIQLKISGNPSVSLKSLSIFSLLSFCLGGQTISHFKTTIFT